MPSNKQKFTCQMEFEEEDLKFLIDLKDQVPALESGTIVDAVRWCIKREREDR